MFQVLEVKAAPIVKLFNNRREEYNQTLGFIAKELVFIEEVIPDDTFENLYKKNIISTIYMMKNVQEVDGTFAVRLTWPSNS